jgi:hypothetical protein
MVHGMDSAFLSCRTSTVVETVHGQLLTEPPISFHALKALAGRIWSSSYCELEQRLPLRHSFFRRRRPPLPLLSRHFAELEAEHVTVASVGNMTVVPAFSEFKLKAEHASTLICLKHLAMC